MNLFVIVMLLLLLESTLIIPQITPWLLCYPLTVVYALNTTKSHANKYLN